jgi:Hg(II)-responsive transcriptional regulator
MRSNLRSVARYGVNLQLRLDSVAGYGLYDVDTMTPLTIGRLARRAGVNVETVRYYERRGLLPEPPRTEAGYRQYGPQALRRIRFIKRAQALGFTLEEIGDLLELRVAPISNCDAVEHRAKRAIARIDSKVAELDRMRSALSRLVEACRDNRPTEECPLLDALEGDE